MTEDVKRQKLAIGIGVGMLATSLLMTELILTRLFSVIIWYHFAFLAISVALFGTGTAAILLHLHQARFPREKTGSHLAASAVLLGVAIFLCNAVLIHLAPDWVSEDPEGGSSGFFALLLLFTASAAPFFFGGFAISLAMTRYAEKVHTLYFCDLAGAGLGCLLVIPALGALGAPRALASVAGLAACAAIPFALGSAGGPAVWRKLILPGAVALFFFALALSPVKGLLEVRRAKGQDLVKLGTEFNQWNSFSMVTVVNRHAFRGWGVSPLYQGPFPEQKTLVIDMNALTPVVRFSGDRASLAYLRYDLSAFAYHLRAGRAGKVLVIGAGGGRDVLSALVGGAKRVTAVEINPLIVQSVMRGAYRDFTGALYDRPDVEVVVDDGRGFVRGTRRRFDLIHLSMVDTSAATAAGAYTLTENNLYTVEAFLDYLNHLGPGGLLSVSSVTMPSMSAGARLASLAWRAEKMLGGDPATSVAVVGAPWLERPDSTMYNILVKREPFSPAELRGISGSAAELGFTVEYLPGRPLRPGSRIGQILSAGDQRAMDRLLAGWEIDLSPTTDNRPFFFYQNRLADAAAMIRMMKPAHPWGNGLFVLVKVVLIATGMVFLFLVLPFILRRREIGQGQGPVGWDLAYVGCLGLGFMFVEIGMLQKFSLYLGNPTYTLAVVLCVLLFSGGTGSRLFGSGNPATRRRRLLLVLASLVLFLAAVWQTGLADFLFQRTVALTSGSRALIAAAFLVPVGLLLGIPFPAGLYAVQARAGNRIPWLWAINSAASVLGSVLATVTSMHGGISTTLWVGVGLYALALGISRKL